MSVTENGLRPPDLTVGDVEDHAEEWLIYLYSGKATEADFERFRLWLSEDPQHASMYRRTEQLWQDVVHNDGYKEGVDHDEVSGEVIALADWKTRKAEPLPRPHGQKRRIRFAAGLAAVFVIGLLVHMVLNPVETRRQYVTVPGEIQTVTLPDGSRVTLGGDSVLNTAFSKNRRRVELAAGGAYFDVSADKARPFQVRIDAVAVTVTGTEFDIRRNPEDVQISVAEGHVRVGPAQQPVWGRPKREVVLGAGEQVLATSREGAGPVSTFDRDVAFGWSHGHLVYQDEKLANVVAEVNRYRKSKIQLANRAIGERKVSLIIPLHDTDLLLSALVSGDGMVIRHTSSGVIVSDGR